ncbi:MAG: hypothetical protein QOG58_643 [Caballeronia sp.]|nr:hypothetical protein [Caballeronia sp.]
MLFIGNRRERALKSLSQVEEAARTEVAPAIGSFVTGFDDIVVFIRLPLIGIRTRLRSGLCVEFAAIQNGTLR